MANLNSSRIKAIQVQIAKIEEDIKRYNNDISDIQMNISTKAQQIKNYKAELAKLQTASSDIIISEHAIVRYIERVLKIDMEKLHKEIISDEFKKSVTKLGNGTYTHNNHFIKVVDNVIVTVTAKEDAQTSKPVKPVKPKKQTKKPHFSQKNPKDKKPKNIWINLWMIIVKMEIAMNLRIFK